MKTKGSLTPLKIEASEKGEALYTLTLEEESFFLNDFLEKEIFLEFLGEISCTFCGKPIKKTFNRGSCYQCFISLPQNDMCIFKPETCHFHKGTCRDSVWGETHCFQEHSIYLSYTSGAKVGITRHFRLMTRWLEQGALAGVPLAKVSNRLQAGLVETFLKKEISDRTSWKKMLSKQDISEDLKELGDKLKEKIQDNFNFTQIIQDPVKFFQYPIHSLPEKINSYNLNKTPHIQDKLIGMKGQYLIFENGVLNMKSFAGYLVSLELRS